jgi:hypothetical protein
VPGILEYIQENKPREYAALLDKYVLNEGDKRTLTEPDEITGITEEPQSMQILNDINATAPEPEQDISATSNDTEVI